MTTSGDVVRADVEPAVRGESRTALARMPATGSVGSRNCVSVIHDFLIQTPGSSGPGFISRARTTRCQSSVRRRNRRHRGAGCRTRLLFYAGRPSLWHLLDDKRSRQHAKPCTLALLPRFCREHISNQTPDQCVWPSQRLQPLQNHRSIQKNAFANRRIFLHIVPSGCKR